MSNRDGKYDHWHWKNGKRYILSKNSKRKVYYPWRDNKDLANITKAYNTEKVVDADYEDKATRLQNRPHPGNCGVKGCDSCWYIAL